MPRGVRLDKSTRWRVYVLLTLQKKTVDEVWMVLFDQNPLLVTRERLVDLLRFFSVSAHTPEGRLAVAAYLSGSGSKGGRRPLLGEAQKDIIESIVNEHSGWSDYQIARFYSDCYDGPYSPLVISVSTVQRVRFERKLVILRYTRLAGQASKFDQELHYRLMAQFHPDNIVNIDETHCGKTKWKLVRGKGKKGKRLELKEWVIAGKTFMILGAYTTRGWLWFHIMHGPITHVEIEQALNQYMAPTIVPGNVVMWDNASVHMVPSTVALLDQITNGLRKNVPTCSHRLSPVERGFSSVWGRIRKNEVFASKDPEGAVREAFEHYSILGAGGPAARGHFSAYARRHKDYLELQGALA